MLTLKRPAIFISVVLSALLIAGSAASVFCADAQSPSPLGNKDADKSETAIGDLIADAVRSALQTDISLIAASELKAKDTPFAAGKISSNDVSALISYPDDPLAQINLNGKTIKQALERAVSIYPQPNLGFFQVSGIHFTFDPKQPSGSRITSITIGTSPIDENQTYTCAVTNSMANGALGYWKIWSQDAVWKRVPDNSIEKSINRYFEANPTIRYNVLDRITVK